MEDRSGEREKKKNVDNIKLIRSTKRGFLDAGKEKGNDKKGR